jgi:hypothetical protein
VEITEFDKDYPVEFHMEPISVNVSLSVINMRGNNIPVPAGTLSFHIESDGAEVHRVPVPSDGNIQFRPDTHHWIEIGSEYQAYVTGKPVVSASPATFVYDGNSDITSMASVRLDDAPPGAPPNGITFHSSEAIVGGEIRGSVSAVDEGLGLAPTVMIDLLKPGLDEPVSVPETGISFHPPGTYRFTYLLPDTEDAAGVWRLSRVRISDKAGNTTEVFGDKVDGFTAFASRADFGRFYFTRRDYARAVEQLKMVDPMTDDARYLMSLAEYNQNDMSNATVIFQSIEHKTNYLGSYRGSDKPHIPREMAVRLWSRLLPDLADNRDKPDYLILLGAVAEELGREYEARIYTEMGSKLRGKTK